MIFQRKYNTATVDATAIYIPIIKRGVVDFAVSADWTPAAGDVKISKDGDAAANIGTLPTAVTMGNTAMWKFVFTGTELSAKQIVVMVADSATKAIEDQGFIIETFGDASAMWPIDLSGGSAGAPITSGSGTAQLTVNSGVASANVTQVGGNNVTASSGRMEVNVSHWSGTAVASATSGGYIKSDVTRWLTATPSVLDANGYVYCDVLAIYNDTSAALNCYSFWASMAGTNVYRFWNAHHALTVDDADSTSITLNSLDSAIDDFYNGAVITIVTGPGATQTRKITDYDGTTKIATISPAWEVTPEDTSIYIIMGRIE